MYSKFERLMPLLLTMIFLTKGSLVFSNFLMSMEPIHDSSFYQETEGVLRVQIGAY
ncbi:hypothetical protein D3C87_1075320 [compost metagenome]